MMRIIFIAWLLSAVLPSGAAAQGQNGGSADPAPAREIPRVDVTLSVCDIRIDLEGGRYPTYARGFSPMRDTWAGQISVGYFWNQRWKTEVEFARIELGSSARSDIYDKELIATPTSTHRVFLIHNYSVHRQAVSQVLHFRAKRVWRPFVGAAIGFDRQTNVDTRKDYFEPPLTPALQQSYAAGGIEMTDHDSFPSSFPPPSTAIHVHGFGRAGFKLVAKRFFMVLEGQAGDRVGPVKFGFGLDVF